MDQRQAAAICVEFSFACAFHSAELEYVFGTLDVRQGATWKTEDRKLSEQMMKYWTNFAKAGYLCGGALPRMQRIWTLPRN